VDAFISYGPEWPLPKPKNGRYTLFIRPNFLPVKVYCDMDGGGWTVSSKTIFIYRRSFIKKFTLLVFTITNSNVDQNAAGNAEM